MNTKKTFTTHFIVQTGVMAALVFVITYFRIPLFGSKVHFANAMCLLAGLLFGPLSGGLAAVQVGVLRRVCLVLDEETEEYVPNKIRRQTLRNRLNEMEISNLPDKLFKVMVIKTTH